MALDCSARIVSSSTEEQIDFIEEAIAVIRDVEFAVKHMFLSEILKHDHDRAFINLTTKEEIDFCIELNKQGFQIVGNKHDECTNTGPDRKCFETIYSLLDTFSPLYVAEFGNQLVEKLERVKNNSEHVHNDIVSETAE